MKSFHRRKRFWLPIALGCALGCVFSARAEESQPEKFPALDPKPAPVLSAPIGRNPALRFDDSVIEGVERKPIQGVDVVGNRGRDGKVQHLYKKRVDFEDKNLTLIEELRSEP